MEKSYESKMNPEQQNYIKEKLFEKYGESFQKYGMSVSSNLEICNLAEFFIAEHPEKYTRTAGDENNYRSNEELQKIYAVVDKEKDVALMINTNDKGKVPEGEFGVYDLKNHEFEASEKVKDEIVKYLGIGALDLKQQDEIVNKMFHDLDGMDKLATMDLEKVIEHRKKENPEIQEMIDEKIDEKNAENGISKEKRTQAEKGSIEIVGQENEGKKQEIPAEVQKACKRLGVNQIKGFFYVNASEFSKRIEGTRTNKNGSKVLILQVADSSRAAGPDRYYGYQDDKPVLYGTADSEVRDLTGNVTKLGKTLEPLKPDKKQYIEYEDSQGLVIREEIDDSAELSMQDINRYKKGIEETLTKYSQQIYKIQNDPFLSDEQKIEQIQAVDDWCDKTTTELAIENDISVNDDKAIDEATDKQTSATQDEIEAWEVPGRRERGE